jgi:hypothetical protein
MKKNKISIIIGLVSVVGLFVSCADEKPAEKEVIIVPSSPVVIEKEPSDKSTTVTFDKKGVKIETEK